MEFEEWIICLFYSDVNLALLFEYSIFCHALDDFVCTHANFFVTIWDDGEGIDGSWQWDKILIF